jgi:hypothetical protein
MMTSRERIAATLNFSLSKGERLPRHLWTQPRTEQNWPGQPAAVRARFPEDLAVAPMLLKQPLSTIRLGNPHQVGTYVDEWGCVFENILSGMVGEVKTPIVDDWSDTSRVHIPVEALAVDVDAVNEYCRATDRFVLAGTDPRPFERLQFIRGTEALFVDLALEDEGVLAFLKRMHAFHLEELAIWCRTEVDGLFIMDDWGTQNGLLINPVMWRKIFKPLYKDYIDLAHAHGKKIFMHSDGNILEILPDLIELGLDAINSQIFCMGLEKLSAFKGKITFWGEMDRQRILPFGTVDEVTRAVHEFYYALFANGGIIAQCTFDPTARPENVFALYAAWDSVSQAK